MRISPWHSQCPHQHVSRKQAKTCLLIIQHDVSAGLTCCAVALMEHFQQPRFRTLRAAMFAGLGLWGLVPALHGYMLHHGIAIVEKAVAWDALMGVIYLVRDCPS